MIVNYLAETPASQYLTTTGAYTISLLQKPWFHSALSTHIKVLFFKGDPQYTKVSQYDQDIPQSQTADKPMASLEKVNNQHHIVTSDQARSRAFYRVRTLEGFWGYSFPYGARGEALWQKMVLGHLKGLE